jgi:hypothetical protein
MAFLRRRRMAFLRRRPRTFLRGQPRTFLRRRPRIFLRRRPRIFLRRRHGFVFSPFAVALPKDADDDRHEHQQDCKVAEIDADARPRRLGRSAAREIWMSGARRLGRSRNWILSWHNASTKSPYPMAPVDYREINGPCSRDIGRRQRPPGRTAQEFRSIHRCEFPRGLRFALDASAVTVSHPKGSGVNSIAASRPTFTVPSVGSSVAGARELFANAIRRWPRLRPMCHVNERTVSGRRPSRPLRRIVKLPIYFGRSRAARSTPHANPTAVNDIAKTVRQATFKGRGVAASIDSTFGSCPNWVFPEVSKMPHPHQCVSPERPVSPPRFEIC